MFAIVLLASAAPAVAQPTAAESDAAWSPYLAGGLIGVLSMLTFYASNKPLGASSAYAKVGGMVVGAYIFAATTATAACLGRLGDRGELTWPAAVGMQPRPFIAVFAAVLVLALAGLDRLA